MKYKTSLSSAVIALSCASSPQGESPLQGPFVHQNLAIYLVRGAGTDDRAYITLDEGLREGSVVVRETAAGEVNTLVVENRSKGWLFLHAADVVTGGKQDRTIASDVVVPPGSPPLRIDAFCVEHGRWTGAAEAAFVANTAMASGAALKRRIQQDRDQSAVWDEVARQSENVAAMASVSGGGSPASLSYTGTYSAVVENGLVRAQQKDYIEALLPRVQSVADAVGIVAAVNGELVAADIYGSRDLFRSLAPKLIDSYVREAVLTPGETAKVPRIEDAAAFLADALEATDRPHTVEALSSSMIRKTSESAKSVVFEYYDRDAGLLHRSLLRKK